MIDKEELIKKLNSIFRNVLNDDQINLKINTSKNELEKWDSLNHILLILEIEKKFSIKITAGEIAELNSISLICDMINEKISGEV
tara:strand:+ start:2375 stop:2629 length:255 start_codon:yes stop_codon:yes gene_type:complete